MTTIDHVFIPDGTHVYKFDISALFAGAKTYLDQLDIDNLSAVWGDARAATIHRDDLRGGWFVVKAGARYIAVQGVKAGQWSYTCATEAMARTSVNAAYTACGNVKPFDNETMWCVLDLHNLADHRAPKPTRYVVKRAEEMAHGERCAQLPSWSRDDADRLVSGGSVARFDSPADLYWTTWHAGCGAEFAIVDTLAAKIATKREEVRAAAPELFASSPAKVEPTKPSDEEIVRAWESVMQWREISHRRWPHGPRCPRAFHLDAGRVVQVWANGTPSRSGDAFIGGVPTTFFVYDKARAAVLRTRLAASDRTRRYEVVCEGDCPTSLVGCDVKAGA
jgi:hypothetical protein